MSNKESLKEVIADILGLFDFEDFQNEEVTMQAEVKAGLARAKRAVAALPRTMTELKQFGFRPENIEQFAANIRGELAAAIKAKNALILGHKLTSPFFSTWLFHHNEVVKFQALISSINAGHNRYAEVRKKVILVDKLHSDPFNRTIPFMWQYAAMQQALHTVSDTESSALVRTNTNIYNAFAKAKSDWQRVINNVQGSTEVNKNENQYYLPPFKYAERVIAELSPVRFAPSRMNAQIKYKNRKQLNK